MTERVGDDDDEELEIGVSQATVRYNIFVCAGWLLLAALSNTDIEQHFQIVFIHFDTFFLRSNFCC